MMYLAPIFCLFGGIFGIIKTIQFYRNGENIKIGTLVMAIVGIPAFVAFMLQIFNIIDNDYLAKGLGSKYMIERMEAKKNIAK